MKSGALTLALFSIGACNLVAQSTRVAGRGATIVAPAGWKCNDRLLAAGGPIACTNFSGAYPRGGMLPAGGAEIEVTSVSRPPVLDAYARNELRGVRDLKVVEAPINGKPGLRVSYTDQVAPGVSTDTFVYYVAQGDRLYKFYLTYHSGDAQASALVRTWEALVREAVLN